MRSKRSMFQCLGKLSSLDHLLLQLRSNNTILMNSINSDSSASSTNTSISSSSAEEPRVQSDSFLTLHYRLSGSSGDVINTFLEKPATLSLGTGELSPAMEQCLIGMNQGQRETFTLAKGAAFGEHNAQMVQWVSQELLDKIGTPGETYEIGEAVEFPAPAGQGSYAGVVKAHRPGEVLFDFNHPLVDQALTFEAHIIGIL
jgi:FKBP-type peptidyl-prolyl cis-trans isomerase SlpA